MAKTRKATVTLTEFELDHTLLAVRYLLAKGLDDLGITYDEEQGIRALADVLLKASVSA